MNKLSLYALMGLSVVGFVPFSCSSKPITWRDHNFTSREIDKAPDAMELPRELLAKIEAAGAGSSAGGEGGGEGGAKPEAKAESGKEAGKSEGGAAEGHSKSIAAEELVPLKIYLVEKNRGILRNGSTEIVFVPGGGELDLAHFVEPHNGSFYFVAEFMPELEEAQRKIYYFSRAKKRSIGSETYGAGCTSFYDVTTAFDQAAKGEGFLVNTTGGRHISALAGNYFFVASAKGKVYLANLSVRDTTKGEAQSLQCEQEAPHKDDEGASKSENPSNSVSTESIAK